MRLPTMIVLLLSACLGCAPGEEQALEVEEIEKWRSGSRT